MGYEACLSAIQKAAGEVLSDDDLEAILSDIVRRRASRAKTNPLEGDGAAFAAAGEELAREQRLSATIERRNHALNLVRRTERQNWYATQPKESSALSALNVGSAREGTGLAASVDAERLGLEQKLIGGLIADLRKDGALRVLKVRDKAFDRDVAREMWRLNEGGGTPTGNTLAASVAESLAKFQEAARVMQNDAGAFIRKMPGYIVRQSHDQGRIYRAGYEAWRDKTLPLLDQSTFDGVDNVESFMKAVYSNLASGNHLKARGGDDWLTGFKGPGNLAKRVSQERVLNFKDADAWFDYNESFGASSLLEAAVFGLTRAARNTALMRRWGTNPEAAFNADLDALTIQARERGDVKEMRRLNSWLTRAEFDQVSGLANVPENPRLATVSAVARSLESMAKLGGVVLSSLPDIAVRASTLRHNGVGLLEGYGDAFKSIFEGRSSGEKREIADLLGAGFDGLLGTVLHRFSAEDGVRGITSKALDKFFQLNLLNWWTDAHKTGVALMLSRNLARNQAKEFGKLDGLLQATLTRHGIGESEWGAIRQAATRVTDNRAYLTPDAIAFLPDEALSGLSRDALESKLRSYFADQVNEALTMGGARERAMASLGTKPGTVAGEAVRFMMQFKTYPITFVTRHVAREVNRGGGTGIAHLIAATTVLGYLSQSAKEVAKGRTPRDPSDPKTWMAAMQQGGGLGIYGDFLFGQYNRFGGGLIETAAGPAAGTINDVARVLSTLREGDTHAAAAEGVRTAVSNTPFANLFYTRMALDYLILHQITEMINPGYLQRFERRVQKENGQAFILKPSEAIPHGGGHRLFEGVR
jgi:hypothetical protein